VPDSHAVQNISRSSQELFSVNKFVPIPVAARSQVWVCGRSLAGIAGSNSVGDMDVCVL
jgi:hypothetical protein